MTFFNDLKESICWETWNSAGYRIKTSKAHLVDDENPNKTKCGVWIPSDGNGIVLENGELSDGRCCKCFK